MPRIRVANQMDNGDEPSQSIPDWLDLDTSIEDAEKRFLVENIDKERTRWRKEVRKIATCVHNAMIERDRKELDRLKNKLRIRLNPYHYCAKGRDDGKIIESVSLPSDADPLERAEEFACRIALLLKHDWERSKHDVKLGS